MTNRMTSVSVWASDLEATARFYRDFLGFELDEPHRHDGGDGLHHDLVWGDFETGDVVMLHIALAEGRPKTSGVQLGFGVDDLSRVHDRAGELDVPVVEEPHDEPWGRNAKYADPDGNIVSLSEG